jgi:hypothetical protein
MIHHGEDPVHHESNEHTKIINLILNGQHSYGPTGSTFDFYHARNLYELFFSAVPDLMSYFQDEYSNLLLYKFKSAKSHRTQSDFGPNTSGKILHSVYQLRTWLAYINLFHYLIFSIVS